MLIRSLLRYDAHLSLGGLWIDPVLPESWGDFNATNVDMGGSRFSFNVSPGLKLRISPKELSSTGERALHWLTLRNLTGSARRNDRR
jgi:hypothetical protein